MDVFTFNLANNFQNASKPLLPTSILLQGVPQLKKKKKSVNCVKKYHLFFSGHAIFLGLYDAPNKQEEKKRVIKEHLILYKYWLTLSIHLDLIPS